MKNGISLLDPQGDANRVLMQCAERLLVVQHPDHFALLSLDDNGATWADNPGRLWQWHCEVAASHAAEIAVSEAVAGEIRVATGYLRRARTRRGFERMLGAVREAFLHMEAVGDIPPELTVCQPEDLDRDPLYLGCANGVVDLDGGRLLPTEDGRRKLISRNTGVPFDPGERDDFVDDLLTPLSAPERGYLLATLGHALRGGRSGRWYVLCGVSGSGKSIFLGTIAAALGVVESGGYAFYLADRMMISGRHNNTTRFADHLVNFTRGRIALGDDLPLEYARLNGTLVKTLTGAELLTGWDKRHVNGVPPPVTATIFQAMLPQDLDHLDLNDPALVDRTHVLSYRTGYRHNIGDSLAAHFEEDADQVDLNDHAIADKTLPPSHVPRDGRTRGVGPTSVPITHQARRAMLALLVRNAAANSKAPDAPESVTALLRERRRANIGSVGCWLLDHLRVTEDGDETVLADEIMTALAEDIPPNDQDRFHGRSRREVLALARDLIDGFPTARRVKRSGRLLSAYAGLRLMTNADIHPGGTVLSAGTEARPLAATETRTAYTLGYCRACRIVMLEILQKSHLPQHTEEDLTKRHPCFGCETLLPAGDPFQLLCTGCAGKTGGDPEAQAAVMAVMAAIAAEMEGPEGGCPGTCRPRSISSRRSCRGPVRRRRRRGRMAAAEGKPPPRSEQRAYGCSPMLSESTGNNDAEIGCGREMPPGQERTTMNQQHYAYRAHGDCVGTAEMTMNTDPGTGEYPFLHPAGHVLAFDSEEARDAYVAQEVVITHRGGGRDRRFHWVSKVTAEDELDFQERCAASPHCIHKGQEMRGQARIHE